MAIDVITTTLGSGQVLSTTYQVDFGEIILSGLLLVLAVVLVVDSIKWTVHR